MAETLKDVLVPDNREGVQLQGTNCEATFDESREQCPECRSTDVEEVSGFDVAPDI